IKNLYLHGIDAERIVAAFLALPDGDYLCMAVTTKVRQRESVSQSDKGPLDQRSCAPYHRIRNFVLEWCARGPAALDAKLKSSQAPPPRAARPPLVPGLARPRGQAGLGAHGA